MLSIELLLPPPPLENATDFCTARQKKLAFVLQLISN